MWSTAVATLVEMRLKGVQPNIVTFSAAISACEKGNQWDTRRPLHRGWGLSHDKAISPEMMFDKKLMRLQMIYSSLEATAMISVGCAKQLRVIDFENQWM